VWSNVVVKDLVALKNRCIVLFESSHRFLSVTDFTVQSFHFVIVSIALDSDVSYVLGSWIGECSPFPETEVMTGYGVDGVLYTFVVTPRTAIPYCEKLSDGFYGVENPTKTLHYPLGIFKEKFKHLQLSTYFQCENAIFPKHV